MILIYRIFTFLIYPFLILYFLFRKLKKKEDQFRYKEKLFSSGFNVIREKSKKLIWFHAASIGEFNSIIPVLEQFYKKKNHYEFLITSSTLSSSILAKEELERFENAHHRFLPLDVEFLMKKFISLWKPNIVFLVDSEIWPNLILQAKKHRVPLVLLNGRITLKTFKRWKLFSMTAKKIFSFFDLCIVSNLESKKYLEEFNVKNIFFYGNIKLANQVDKVKINNINSKILLKKRPWLAASTHEGEEEMCLEAHKKLKKRFNDSITIIAPRHIYRIKKIKNLCKLNNLNYQVLHKKDEIISENSEVIILNKFGVLKNYFKYIKSVFIGKSLIKKLKNDSGQNPIEAAKLDCKIYHGPYVYNFREIYDILKNNNVSTEIQNYTELADNLLKDLENPEKKNEENSNIINSLGKKTLTDTIVKINEFLRDEII